MTLKNHVNESYRTFQIRTVRTFLVQLALRLTSATYARPSVVARCAPILFRDILLRYRIFKIHQNDNNVEVIKKKIEIFFREIEFFPHFCHPQELNVKHRNFRQNRSRGSEVIKGH